MHFERYQQIKSLLLGITGPVLFFLSNGKVLQLQFLFTTWLVLPTLLWRFGEPIREA